MDEGTDLRWPEVEVCCIGRVPLMKNRLIY
jgi:hypothetical protein